MEQRKDIRVPRQARNESFTTYAFRTLVTVGLGFLSYQQIFPHKPAEDASTSSQVYELKAKVEVLTIRIDNFNSNFNQYRADMDKDIDEIKDMVRYNYKSNRRRSDDNSLGYNR